MISVSLLALLSLLHESSAFVVHPSLLRVCAPTKPRALPVAFMVKVENRTAIAEATAEQTTKHLLEIEKPGGSKKGSKGEIDSTNMKTETREELLSKAVWDEDAALRLLSSEIGVKRFISQNMTSEVALPLDVIFDRTLDTVEDALVHARRIPYDLGWISEEEVEKDNRRTVVVLGSGWGAHAFMKIADTFEVKVIVVSPSNHFVFTPMLASAAVGTVEYRSMTEAVRAANPMVQYVEGKATDVDVDKKSITVKLNSLLEDIAGGDPPTITIPYDTLVVSVGTQVADSVVPGASKRSLGLKSCDDARKLRTAVGESFEYASRPDTKFKDEERRRRVTFMIVGGGPTGVELAGELVDFCRDITRPRVGAFQDLRDAFRVMLVHGGPDILPQFDANLREDGLKALTKRNVEVMLNTLVQEVGDGFVKLFSKTTKEEQAVPVGLTVWAAGNRPVPFVETLLSKLPDSARGVGGRVEVDKWCRCPTNNPKALGSILVVGDAACFAGKGNSEILPQTAQVAGQQGAYVGRLLNRGYDLSSTPPALPLGAINGTSNNGENNDSKLARAWLKLRGLEEAQGFNFLNLGLLAYVGGNEALSQVQIGDVPVFSYAGSVAYVLWRSVYLVKQVATRNRVLVTFDWMKSALFGRDITRL